MWLNQGSPNQHESEWPKRVLSPKINWGKSFPWSKWHLMLALKQDGIGKLLLAFLYLLLAGNCIYCVAATAMSFLHWQEKQDSSYFQYELKTAFCISSLQGPIEIVVILIIHKFKYMLNRLTRSMKICSPIFLLKSVIVHWSETVFGVNYIRIQLLLIWASTF